MPSMRRTNSFVGRRVSVTFGPRRLTGLVISQSRETELNTDTIKAIDATIDTDTPCLPTESLNLLKWVSNYYQHPIGEVVFSALPSELRSGGETKTLKVWQLTHEGKGLNSASLKRSPKQQALITKLLEANEIVVSSENRKHFSASAIKALIDKGLIVETKLTNTQHRLREDIENLNLLNAPPLELNQEQRLAFEKLTFHRYNCALLNGVTGSGKTELYLQWIHRALLQKQSVLYLVPEIGLTHQTITRIKRRFAIPICIQHSGMSEKQRVTNWVNARENSVSLVIGTRLAVLSPIKNLGLIIVDEEHDASYKQQDGGPRYSARDVAVIRAHDLNIPVVLGSATPSLESQHNANNKRYTQIRLNSRPQNTALPTIQLADLRNQPLTAGLTQQTITDIEAQLKKQNQVLVFLNRRGYAPVLQCHSCGWIADCPSCTSNFTVHNQPKHLRCHQCDRQQSIPKVCPNCKSTHLINQGVGTEQLEIELNNLFPHTPIIRFDRDSVKSKRKMDEQLEQIQQGKPAIIVGTQMISKGHHFPKLSLAVISDIDQGLFSANFRGSERMGQLIIQVSGRAGRESSTGTVILQTHNPEHPLLKPLLTHDYSTFSDALMQSRSQANMPPFWHLVEIRTESKRPQNATELLNTAKHLSITILNELNASQDEAYILGPIPHAIEKVQDRYRFVLQLKAQNRRLLKTWMNRLLEEINQQAASKRTRWSVDVDPY